MEWCFFEVCRRNGLKVNVDKSKVMMVGGGMEWSVRSMWEE